MIKKLKKPLIAIIIVIAALVLIVFTGLSIMAIKGFSLEVGTYIRTNGGADMIVSGSSPMVLSNQTRGLFSDMRSGDKILIVHDGVNTSYPAATGCYFCLRLGKGSLSDVPEATLSELKKLGWVTP